MNLGQLVQQHRTTLGVAGAAVVAGLALMQARKRDGDGGGPAVPDVYPSLRSAASTGGAPSYGYPLAGYATYDSTSSDLYNAIQPQIEYLQRLTEEQAGKPIPVASPSPAAGLKAGFYKMAGTPNLYRVDGGRIDYLTRAEYQAMTKGQKAPSVTTISKDNPVFQSGGHWLDPHKQTPPAK